MRGRCAGSAPQHGAHASEQFAGDERFGEEVVGPGAEAFLSRRVCRRIRDMRAGQVRYGLVLADDGTVELEFGGKKGIWQ